jgi:hypothetical protein
MKFAQILSVYCGISKIMLGFMQGVQNQMGDNLIVVLVEFFQLRMK